MNSPQISMAFWRIDSQVQSLPPPAWSRVQKLRKKWRNGKTLSGAEQQYIMAIARRMDMVLEVIDGGRKDGLITKRRKRQPARVEYSERIAKQIVRKVERGETIKNICATDEMPNNCTVAKWAQRHRWFGEALAQARVKARRLVNGTQKHFGSNKK